MPKVSRRSASQVDDLPFAEDRHEDLAGCTVNFVTLRQDMDLAPLLAALPGGLCSCPHTGYVFAGRVTVAYPDREETFEAGDAFSVSAGHTASAVTGTEFVQFSPTDELRVVEEAMARAAAARA